MSLLYWAELTKVAGRPSTRVAFVLLCLFGALGPFLMSTAGGASFNVNGQDTAPIDLCAANGVVWSLWLRGCFVAQTALLLLASQSFAGELVAQTLRDELVRPVARWKVLLAKLGALATFSFASGVGAFVVSAAVAVVLLPSTGEATWGAALAGAAAAVVCESGFAMFALTTSVLARSVAGGLAAGFVLVLGARALSVAFTVAAWVAMSIPPEMFQVPASIDALLGLAPFLPAAGWGAFEAVSHGDAVWQHWAALVAWTVTAAALGFQRFARCEIP